MEGDPNDIGFAGSWWTGVVVSVRTERRGRRMEQRLTVLYDEVRWGAELAQPHAAWFA